MPTTTTTSKVEWEEGAGGFRLELPVAPVPASRPRVTKWGTYYTKTYKNWMADADASIPDAEYQLDGLVTVEVHFICYRPKTTKLIRPKGDIDNYEKAIFDAVTKKGYWVDDMDIIENNSFKRFASPGEQPRIVLYARSIP